ncbi:SBBP repeat-containing protein [Lentzea sp. NPDC051213]|uniref:SBBP repeat-containing protein n=1 Tax=Lentzea sp. NPDC051213 TaxID=3364126 RepID=UPI003793A06A
MRIALAIMAALLLVTGTAQAAPKHISASAPSLHPEGVQWDPTRGQFLVGSLRHGTVSLVSRDGKVRPLVTGTKMVSTLGIQVDRGRLLVAYADIGFGEKKDPGQSGLGIFDLRTGRTLQLVDIPNGANDIAVDPQGNAYVTGTMGDTIWKVDRAGVVTPFARDPRLGGAAFGNNGIVWDPRGFLVTGHYTNGTLFKVTRDRVEELPVPKLPGADGLVLTPRGLVVVTNNLAAPGKNAVTTVDTRTWRVTGQRDWGTTPTTAARTPYGTYVLSGYIDVLAGGGTSDEFRLDR